MSRRFLPLLALIGFYTAVAPGDYQVALGWYAATTGDRLAITNHPQQTDNRALLPETVRLPQPNQP